MTHMETLQSRLQPLYAQLSGHSLYGSIHSIGDLHTFQQSHVFAVWDFMSLLKALQRGLTCVNLPWTPSHLPESRRLINEIVLGEESDLYDNEPISHFELYMRAMGECRADTSVIDSFLALLRSGRSVGEAIRLAKVPVAAAGFVESTFATIATGKLHVIAAAFTFGREDLIPDMFQGFVRDLNAELAGQLSTFIWYLERHIEVDGEEHGPMSLRMVEQLCGNDPLKWSEATGAAQAALHARLQLWDGIAECIRMQQPALATA